MNKKTTVNPLPILGAIVLLALFLRLSNYVGPVRGDDFKYASAAFDLPNGEINKDVCCGLQRVGLYLPIAAAYSIFGVSESASVAFPLLSSLATVILIYAIGKHLKDEVTGLIAAMLWATFPIDIFASTQLLPDAPLNALLAGAILLLLKGQAAQSSRRAVNWFVMLFLLLWAYFVKEISLLTTLFCLAYVLAILLNERFPRLWPSFTKRLSSRRFLIALLIVLALFSFLAANTLLRYKTDNPMALYGQTATDMLESFYLGLSPYGYEDEISARTSAFDLYLPIFLIATLFLLWDKKKNSLFPILWFFFLFMMSEWGAELNFGRGLPFVYKPPDPELVIDRRHMMFMQAPAFLIISMYFSTLIRKISLRNALTALALVLAFWLFVRPGIYAGEPLPILDRVLLSAILASLVSPILLREGAQRYRQLAASFILLLLLFAAQKPILRYHAIDWQNEQTLMAQLSDAADFLAANSPEWRIRTIPGNDKKLSYASEFELGYNWEGSTAHYPQARILNDKVDEIGDQSLYIVYEDTASHKHADLINPLAWPLIQFGNSQDATRIIVFRDLNEEDAIAEYSQAKEAHALDPSSTNQQRLLAAAVNAGDLQSALDLWPILADAYPQEVYSRLFQQLQELQATQVGNGQ